MILRAYTVHFNFIVQTHSFRYGILPRITYAISSIIRLSRNLASYYVGVKGTGDENRRMSDSTTAWPAAREQEGRSKARDRHGRKLVSFVKFLERKVPLVSPRPPSSFSRSSLGSALPCPSRPDRNLSRMVREFTTKVLLARTWPYFIYLVRLYSTDSYISTKLPLTIFQGDCPLNSSL